MLNSPIDEIKNRLGIEDVVREYVKLEKAGINYRAICPFHSEKTPSFFVNPGRQRWHCFGSCSEGGDIFGFIMKIEGIEFGDALRILAVKAGVELKRQDPKIRSERQKIYEVCEWAARFFEKQIESKIGQSVLDYLLKRGIGREEIKEWRVGYAPESWEDLIEYLKEKRYSNEEITKAGLAVQKEDSSKLYNRFRGRIIFPIFDLNSQPIGFGGRLFDIGAEERKEAKYLNTINTPLYDKSRVLYGLHRAKIEMRKGDFCIITEGYTDVIMSHKAGFVNTISTSGTALTGDQLAVIKRYTNNLVTAFDMDKAGESATGKGIEAALLEGFNIKIALMTPGLDPAEIILKNPAEWKKAVEGAVSVMEFHFQRAFSDKDPAIPENKKKIGAELLPKIVKIGNDIERASWTQRLARDLGVREEAIIDEMRKIKKEAPLKLTPVYEKKDRRSRKEMLEERFLMLAVCNPQFLTELTENDKQLLSKETCNIIDAISEEKEVPTAVKETIDYLAMMMEVEGEGIDAGKEYEQCLKELRAIVLKERLREISDKIREAEARRDVSKTEELTKEFNSVSRALNS